MFEESRLNLPKVPSCRNCNNKKSALEHYVAAALLAGSRLPDGNRYRQEKVSRRLSKNVKLQKELGVWDPPVWMKVNGVVRQMHVLKLDATKICRLMEFITKGLYRFHFGKVLSSSFQPRVNMFAPENEAALRAWIQPFFPADSRVVSGNIGEGSFIYVGRQSSIHEGLTLWQMTWHNGIALYGEGAPKQGVSVFWSDTRLTEEAAKRFENASIEDVD
jgi:hypothetical protein